MNRFWNVFYMDIRILSANQKWLPFEVSGNKELIMANDLLSSAASFIILNAFFLE